MLNEINLARAELNRLRLFEVTLRERHVGGGAPAKRRAEARAAS